MRHIFLDELISESSYSTFERSIDKVGKEEYLKMSILMNEMYFYNSRGIEFINMIETTSMSKSYKIPVFLAFYNNRNVKIKIDEEDIYKSFYEFYHRGSNKVDMLRHKATADFESWGKKEYVKLAKDNPIKFLIKTHGDFLKKSNDGLIELYDDMSGPVGDREFVEHMIDAI